MKNRSLITVVISRWVSPFIFLYGIYIILYGHISPGGGFPGGVILACSFILALLARGKNAALKRLPYGLAKKLDASGALVFLSLALSGIFFTGVFFSNFLQKLMPGKPLQLISGGTILIINIAIGVKICASVFLIILFISVLRIRKDKEIQTMEEN